MRFSLKILLSEKSGKIRMIIKVGSKVQNVTLSVALLCLKSLFQSLRLQVNTVPRNFLCPFSINFSINKPRQNPMRKNYMTALFCLFVNLIYAQEAEKDTLIIKTPKDSIRSIAAVAAALASTDNPYVPNNIPPSANAASLGKYGDSLVSYYTGLASTDVKLYNIVSKDISLPPFGFLSSRGNQSGRRSLQCGAWGFWQFWWRFNKVN